jgi:ATP/maltotriose-dependent transcriptional regulator MalT
MRKRRWRHCSLSFSRRGARALVTPRQVQCSAMRGCCGPRSRPPDTCAGTPDRSAPEVHQLPVTSLTRREQEVLELIAAGLSNQAIAERLFVATSTVKSYINSIFRRLGVTSRTQAVAAARALHLISG